MTESKLVQLNFKNISYSVYSIKMNGSESRSRKVELMCAHSKNQKNTTTVWI